jgi:hypothetical protein
MSWSLQMRHRAGDTRALVSDPDWKAGAGVIIAASSKVAGSRRDHISANGADAGCPCCRVCADSRSQEVELATAAVDTGAGQACVKPDRREGTLYAHFMTPLPEDSDE